MEINWSNVPWENVFRNIMDTASLISFLGLVYLAIKAFEVWYDEEIDPPNDT